jgi:AraC family transcriptional regulator of arabinose operon
VARTVGLSPFRLSHVVKDFTGRSVLQIIHQVRIRHAQHLLERSAKSCAEIAYEVGFSDQSYFIRHFRRQTGTTPRRYRHSREAPSETTE